jgi:hypothetical protein
MGGSPVAACRRGISSTNVHRAAGLAGVGESPVSGDDLNLPGGEPEPVESSHDHQGRAPRSTGGTRDITSLRRRRRSGPARLRARPPVGAGHAIGDHPGPPPGTGQCRARTARGGPGSRYSTACGITARGTAARGCAAARGQSRLGRGGPSLPLLLARPAIATREKSARTIPASAQVPCSTNANRRRSIMSAQQRETLDAILRQNSFPADSDISEQRRLLKELVAGQPLSADLTVAAATLGGVPGRRDHHCRNRASPCRLVLPRRRVRTRGCLPGR